MVLFLIALGGAAGSVLRYLIGGAVQRASHSGFPFGTLIVNVLGCVAVGLLFRAFPGHPHQQELRAALIIGFCGGFTTFSTFSVETIGLIQGGEWTKATLYVALSVAAGLAATALALGKANPR
jgi:CrcB protein